MVGGLGGELTGGTRFPPYQTELRVGSLSPGRGSERGVGIQPLRNWDQLQRELELGLGGWEGEGPDVQVCLSPLGSAQVPSMASHCLCEPVSGLSRAPTPCLSPTCLQASPTPLPNCRTFPSPQKEIPDPLPLTPHPSYHSSWQALVYFLSLRICLPRAFPIHGII